MSNITKTAIISVVGRPNVGKSTLTNKLVGYKVAIVSNKPQTTRTRITGVLTQGDCQFVFLDTPGLHKPRSKLGDFMVKVVTDTVSEVDVAALVVEPKPEPGPAEESLIGQIQAGGIPSILVINKVDTVPREELLAVIAAYAEKHDFDAVIPVSARTGEGTDVLLAELKNLRSKARRCSRRTWFPTSPSARSRRKSSARRCCACSSARCRTASRSALSAGTSARTALSR